MSLQTGILKASHSRKLSIILVMEGTVQELESVCVSNREVSVLIPQIQPHCSYCLVHLWVRPKRFILSSMHKLVYHSECSRPKETFSPWQILGTSGCDARAVRNLQHTENTAHVRFLSWLESSPGCHRSRWSGTIHIMNQDMCTVYLLHTFLHIKQYHIYMHNHSKSQHNATYIKELHSCI